MKINVCLCCDDNYAPQAGVVVASILANAKPDDRLHFHIIDDGISAENRRYILALREIRECCFSFVSVDPALFLDYLAITRGEHISQASYYRLSLSSMLPHVRKVIYLDCDTVVNSSLGELAKVDLGGNVMGGVLDIGHQRLRRKTGLDPSACYVNAGVLIMDLARIREERIEKAFLVYATEHADEIFHMDQQIINVVLEGRIACLDNSWNVQTSNFVNRSSYIRNPSIVHYVSRQKPWIYESFNHHTAYYYKYLELTPWALKLDDAVAWHRKRQLLAWVRYLKYRPLVFFRPRFWKALYLTRFRRN